MEISGLSDGDAWRTGLSVTEVSRLKITMEGMYNARRWCVGQECFGQHSEDDTTDVLGYTRILKGVCKVECQVSVGFEKACLAIQA